MRGGRGSRIYFLKQDLICLFAFVSNQETVTSGVKLLDRGFADRRSFYS